MSKPLTEEQLVFCRDQIEQLESALRVERKKLKERCHHPSKYRKIKNWSDGGSYYDRCVYYTTIKCEICGYQETNELR